MSNQLIENQIYYEIHDNVATTVFSRTMPVNSFAVVYVQGVAVRPGNGDSKTWYQTFTCGRRSSAPVLNATTNIVGPIADAGASGWNVIFSVSGNDILVQFQGQSLADTFWFFKISVLLIQG